MEQNLLAIDSSSEGCSIALNIAGQCFTLVSEEPRTHARSLLPMIDKLLQEQQCPLSKLDAIALVHGPGSFTGIRIALSVAQGLAYGAKLPLIGLSSLRCLAERAIRHILPQAPVSFVCAIDARMQEVYWAVYDYDGEALTQSSAEAVSSYEQFNQAVAALAKPVVGIGSAFALPEIELGCFESSYAELEPSAEALIQALECEPDFNALTSTVMELEPLYLRNEVAWQKRQRIRTKAPNF
ncbi:tRNA (adenosine(37)-N6)-threonylcarbamoyltransferase complex dimerization subunit type 1 TsaB [Agaribacterium sp. ZY112]|uniref:tRNA (adenosine(37)-N6)-threonylcarbamoyltransferase complex dimerization subunit type 1 TsaB n=1 Tax=Agaribacterium sp. ZY112 TaxID=3233574 RepID=UPI0035266B92